MLFVEFGHSVHFDVDSKNEYYRLKTKGVVLVLVTSSTNEGKRRDKMVLFSN